MYVTMCVFGGSSLYQPHRCENLLSHTVYTSQCIMKLQWTQHLPGVVKERSSAIQNTNILKSLIYKNTVHYICLFWSTECVFQLSSVFSHFTLQLIYHVTTKLLTWVQTHFHENFNVREQWKISMGFLKYAIGKVYGQAVLEL